MKEEEILKYKKYLTSVYDFMLKHGYVNKPYPKVVFHEKEPEDDILTPTAYYDPNTNKIHLYYKQRWYKDVVRSFCHECIHKTQGENGDIEKSGYSSDKITEDKNLIHLEAEAYLKGNMVFRSWTETMQKNAD